MDKQFFICHSSKDANLAKALLEELEALGYKCWVSSRDAQSGSDREKSVYSAILESAAVLLVFSENATDSHHIRGELEIAANMRIPIVTLKFREAEASKSILYYTNAVPWIDCITGQVNTPGISEALLTLVKQKPQKTDTELKSGRGGKLKWIAIPAIIFIALLSKVFLASGTAAPSLSNLGNIALGGRDSWDYASDVVSGINGGTILSGAWDTGLWSEIWVAYFDNSGSFVNSWSDSVTGESIPLLLSMPDGGCMCVYTNSSDSDDSSFVYRAVRLSPGGSILWEIKPRIDYSGDGFPVITSLDWLDENRAIAGFIKKTGSESGETVYFAELDASTGTGETFEVPGNFENQCTAVSDNGQILLFNGAYGTGLSTFKVLNQHGIQDQTILSDQRSIIHCARFCTDGSVVTVAVDMSREEEISITKLTSSFEIEWECTPEEVISGIPADLYILPDGSIILAGSTIPAENGQSDGLVVCIDKSGKLQWKSIIDTGEDDHIISVNQREDGILLLSGSTTRFGDRDAWLVEMNTDGECNSSCIQGVPIFSENWDTGFITQEFWMLGSAGSTPPEVISNGSGEDLALTVSNSPVLQRQPLKLTSGLCFSAEITVSDVTLDSNSNWVSIGTAESYLYATNQETADCELRWNYGAEQELTISSSRVSPRNVLDVPVQLASNMPHLFIIENHDDSVFFLINDSLIATLASLSAPDSLRLFINGNSTSMQHLVDNIRVYRRDW